MADLDDWEAFADEDAVIEQDDNKNKFADEEIVDKDKEEREAKQKAEESKIAKEEAKKQREEKKKDEKDYDKMFNDRFEKAGAVKLLSREEIKKKNPGLTEAQIDELMSRQAEENMGDNLFGDDTDQTPKAGLGSSITELKGEKAYKEFGREIAKHIAENGQSNNHIPKFFSELFNGLADKITIVKMRNIVSDFDNKLQKRKEEEDRKEREAKKLEKKPKNKKKATLGGVTKALDTNKLMLDDVFEDEQNPEGEDYDDYGDEGDQYVDYGKDQYDFM